MMTKHIINLNKLFSKNLSQRILKIEQGYHSGLPYLAIFLQQKEDLDLWKEIIMLEIDKNIKGTHFKNGYILDTYLINSLQIIEIRYSTSKKEKKILKNTF